MSTTTYVHVPKLDEDSSPAPVCLSDLRVKIFADGADRADMVRLSRDPLIAGFTTNPTLMRKAGVADYEYFARETLAIINGRPISFEVFADEPEPMLQQAIKISSWGDNVYVKIPVMNTRGESTSKLLTELTQRGVKLNVTAVMTLAQVRAAAACVASGSPCCISVFAGRIADTGRDPVEPMRQAVEIVRAFPNIDLLWASPRQVLDVVKADQIGCHIITVASGMLDKLSALGRGLHEFSLDTVKMFYEDARQAGYSL